MKKIHLSVSIPAYNEEKNIERVLSQVFSQSRSNYILDTVSVYSDGSTDNTADIVKSKFKQVKLKDYKKNLGKNRRVNQMLQANTSDLLVQIDSDIKLHGIHVFEELVKTYQSKKKVGLVCAYHKAIAPDTVIGRTALFGFKVWDRARNSLGKNGIRYYCEGGLRVFSRDFASEFRLPADKHVGEDSFSFYEAISKGYRVLVNKRAVVCLELPATYSDYTKQMKRFLLDPGMVKETFENEHTKKYEVLTSRVKLRALVFEFINSPFVGFCYVLLQTTTKLQLIFYKPDNKWTPIERQ